MARSTRRPLVLVTLITSLLATLVVVPAQGHPEGSVVDQALTGDPPCTADAFPAEPALDVLTPLRQGFVPSGGAVAAVDLCLTIESGDVAGGLPKFTVNVIDLDAPGGEAVVATRTVSMDEVGASPGTGWVHVDLEEVAVLAAGGRHAIELDAPRATFRWRATCGAGVDCSGTTDAYGGGGASGMSGPLDRTDSENADFGFRTYLPDPGDIVVDVSAPALVCPAVDSLAGLAVTVSNVGAASVAPFTVDLALEADDGVQTLGVATIDGLGVGQEVVLDAAAFDAVAPDSGAPARGRIVAVADAAHAVTEFSDDNNTGADDTTRVPCDPGALDGLTLVAGSGHSLPEVPAGLTDLDLLSLPPDQVAAGAAGFSATGAPTRDGAPVSSDPTDVDTLQGGADFAPANFGPANFGPANFGPANFGPANFGPANFGPANFGPANFGPANFGPANFGPANFGSLLDSVDAATLDRIPLVLLQTAESWPVLIARYSEQPDISDVAAAEAAEQRLLDQPIQDLTLADVLVRLDPPLALRMDQVDTGAAMDLSLLGVSLSSQPIGTVPTPTGDDWCTYIAATSFLDCASAGIDPATETFISLDVRGYPVRELDLTGVSLRSIGLRADTILGQIPLADPAAAPLDPDVNVTTRNFHTTYTAIGNLAVAEAFTDPGAIIACAPGTEEDPCGGSVSAAENAFAFLPGTTVADLVAALTPTAASLLDVPNGLIGASGLSDVPWGRLNTNALDADVLSDGTCPAIDYTASASVVTSAPVVDPVVEVTTPEGFDLRSGSATATVDGGAAIPLADPVETPLAGDRTRLRFTVPAIVADQVSVSFLACAGTTLGVQIADADLSWTTFEGDGSVALVERAVAPEDADTTFAARHADVVVVERREPDDAGDLPVLAPATVAYRHFTADDIVDLYRIPIGTTLPNGAVVEPGDRIRLWAGPPGMSNDDGRVLDVDLSVHLPDAADTITDSLLSAAEQDDAGADRALSDDDAQTVDGQYDSIAPPNVQDAPANFGPANFGPANFGPANFGPARVESRQRGDRTEYVQFDLRPGDSGDIVVRVSSHLNVTNDQPYALYLQLFKPLGDIAPCPAPGDFAAPPTSPGVGDVPPGTETLFLLNETLTAAVHGAVPTAEMLTSLSLLAQHDAVKGHLVPVERDARVAAAYETWRSTPAWCTPAGANEVVGSIRALAHAAVAEAPTIRNIVLVGGDNLVPLARIPDTVDLAPASMYLGDVLATTQSNNPLVASVAANMIQSDDPYTALDSVSWGDDRVFVPTLAGGRLVETPADIKIAADQFLLSDGYLDLGANGTPDALTAGHTWLTDGALAVADGLTALGATVDDDYASGGWDRAAITDRLSATDPDFVLLNAHANHSTFLTAVGDANHDPTEVLTTRDAEDGPIPLGRVLFAIGCNLGVNVPAAYVNDTPVYDITGEELDYAELIGQRAGFLLANTSFGYGTDESVDYSERLMAGFAHRLATTETIGEAVAAAKADYVLGVAQPGSLDRKSLLEAVGYGLPMYRVHDVPPVDDVDPPAPVVTDVRTGLDTIAVSTGTIEVGTAAGCTTGLCFERTDAVGPNPGTFFDLVGADGDPLVTNGHAVVPQFEQRWTLPDAELGGFVPSSIESVDVPGSGDDLAVFDPFVARALLASEQRELPREALDQAGPGLFGSTASVGDVVGLTLPLGFFQGASHDADGQVLGRMSLDTAVDGTVYVVDATVDDELRPEIHRVDIRVADGGTGTAPDLVTVELAARDDSAIVRGVTALRVDGDWLVLEHAVESGVAPFGATTLVATVGIPADVRIDRVMHYVVDTAGRVGVGLNKNLEPFQRPVEPSGPVTGVDPEITLTGERVGNAYRSDVTLTVTGGTSGPYHVFVDGQETPVATLGVGGSTVLSGTGEYVVRVVGDDAEDKVTLVYVLIDVTPPSITPLSPAPTTPLAERTYVSGAQVPIEVDCTDLITVVVRCEAIDDDGLVDTARVGDFTLRFEAEDAVGNTAVVQVPYRVTSRYSFDGFYSPVGYPTPDGEGYVLARSGKTVPFKFNVLDVDTGVVLTHEQLFAGDAATFQRVTAHGEPLGDPFPAVSNPAFRYTTDQWVFNAVTAEPDGTGFAPGHFYRFAVRLVDGNTLTALVEVT